MPTLLFEPQSKSKFLCKAEPHVNIVNMLGFTASCTSFVASSSEAAELLILISGHLFRRLGGAARLY